MDENKSVTDQDEYDVTDLENASEPGIRNASQSQGGDMDPDKSVPQAVKVDMSRIRELEAENRSVVNKKKERQKEPVGFAYAIHRIAALLMFFLIFLPNFNPAALTTLISKNLSLFTSAISYNSLIENVGRGFRRGWVEESTFHLLYIGCLVTLVGILVVSSATCINLGNRKCKRLSFILTFGGIAVLATGLGLVIAAYGQFSNSQNQDKVGAGFASGIIVIAVLAVIILITTIIEMIGTPRPEKNEKFSMETRFKLFLMFLPFALLAFVFCYLPLWGWRYSFFDYRAGGELSSETWVGFKWFKYLFENEATRGELVRVLRNTLAMSGLGIITSWIPLAFAIFLTEIKSKPFKRIVQTFTTIPNFISWILVYTVALAIFSTDGFINTIFGATGNHLMGDNFTWLKMLAWGLWKGVGWSAIIYIAGISGIDRQLYEAATVDGAGRFQRIWHVTLPGLLPTYMVMLLMAVAGMLSNGLDQYLVFSNADNMNHMEVLDLYVYHLGFGGGSIPLSTVIGMAKSLVSVALLFMANGISKLVRKESII